MRAGLLLTALLFAACSGAPSSQLSAAPAEPVRILAQGLSIAFEEPFSVFAATNLTEHEALWDRLDHPTDTPDVDFERELVVYLGMAGSSSCPESFQRLIVDLDANRVHGEWQNLSPGNACTDDLAAQGVLLAVSRAELPTTPFILSLRAQPICADCPEHPDQMVVDPAAR